MSNEFTIEYIGVLEGHGGAVTSLVCGENKDGSSLLLSGSRDKSIIRWELNFEGTKVTYKDDEDNEDDENIKQNNNIYKKKKN